MLTSFNLAIIEIYCPEVLVPLLRSYAVYIPSLQSALVMFR